MVRFNDSIGNLADRLLRHRPTGILLVEQLLRLLLRVPRPQLILRVPFHHDLPLRRRQDGLIVARAVGRGREGEVVASGRMAMDLGATLGLLIASAAGRALCRDSQRATRSLSRRPQEDNRQDHQPRTSRSSSGSPDDPRDQSHRPVRFRKPSS